jgi:hypothetical protein
MKSYLRFWLVLFALALPALLTGSMGLRSYTHRDMLLWALPRVTTPTTIAMRGRYLISDGGTVVVGVEDGVYRTGAWISGHTYIVPPGVSLESFRHEFRVTSFGFWGDNYVDAQPLYVNHEHFVRIPWWAILLAVLLPTAPTTIYIWRRYKPVWVRRGFCAKCGYDLRATPLKCPECGTTPSL